MSTRCSKCSKDIFTRLMRDLYRNVEGRLIINSACLWYGHKHDLGRLYHPGLLASALLALPLPPRSPAPEASVRSLALEDHCPFQTGSVYDHVRVLSLYQMMPISACLD